ncbi:MAG: hypothetical protein E7501_00075 [Ruminococcus sp.]|nr:hypothetical protein [Ruminococcus sp.]MBQ8905688.1 hypothetical protein [Ruminococcus sp.]
MNYFTYKDYPLVRNKKEIYYGSMADDYVVWMQILNTKQEQGMDIATKVKLYLMSTDEKLNPMEAISKTGERESLYEALDLAAAWLDRANAS